MKFNLITNVMEGHGLKHDCEIVSDELRARGHEVVMTQFNAAYRPARVDVNVFLERIVPPMFPLADRNIVIPNPEWWRREKDAFLPFIDEIWCKTADSMRLFENTGKAKFIGFRSVDIRVPRIERRRTFLHVAGKSGAKGTRSILAAWKKFKICHNLTVISSLDFGTLPDNVTQAKSVNASIIKILMNASLFHLCFSDYEGWGHTIHEAMGCGNIVLTMNAPPMNEWGIDERFLARCDIKRKMGRATLWSVEPCEVHRLVNVAMALDKDDAFEVGSKNRKLFEEEKIKL